MADRTSGALAGIEPIMATAPGFDAVVFGFVDCALSASAVVLLVRCLLLRPLPPLPLVNACIFRKTSASMAGLCRLAAVRGRPGGFTFGAGCGTLTTNPGRIRRGPYRRSESCAPGAVVVVVVVVVAVVDRTILLPPLNTNPSGMDEENC